MSVVFSGTNQGRFTANGQNIFIPLPPAADYIEILNETIAYGAAPGANTGVKFEYSLGDTPGRGTLQFVTNAGFPVLNIGQIAVGAGFFFIDTTNRQPGPLNNGSTGITAISTATPARVTVGSTAGMRTGQTVQLYNIAGAPQLSGMQFSITVINGTTFDLTNGPVLAVAGTTGSFRVIPYEPLNVIPFPGIPGQLVTPVLAQDPYWYPTYRTITNISQAANAIVTLAVTHSYTVGQKISFRVPVVTATVFGMPLLNDREATIIAINQADANGFTNTITVDVDTTAMGPFAFPVAASPGYTPAMVVPVGENTAQALASGVDILADATENQAARGVLLIAGALSPAGATGNVIVWKAGKSFNGI